MVAIARDRGGFGYTYTVRWRGGGAVLSRQDPSVIQKEIQQQ